MSDPIKTTAQVVAERDPWLFVYKGERMAKWDELIEYWRLCAVQQRKLAAFAKIDADKDEHMEAAHQLETWVARATGEHGNATGYFTVPRLA